MMRAFWPLMLFFSFFFGCLLPGDSQGIRIWCFPWSSRFCFPFLSLLPALNFLMPTFSLLLSWRTLRTLIISTTHYDDDNEMHFLSWTRKERWLTCIHCWRIKRVQQLFSCHSPSSLPSSSSILLHRRSSVIIMTSEPRLFHSTVSSFKETSNTFLQNEWEKSIGKTTQKHWHET